MKIISSLVCELAKKEKKLTDVLSTKILKNKRRDRMARKFKGNPFKSKFIFEIISVNNNTATISGLRISKYINNPRANMKMIMFKFRYSW